MSEDFYHRLNQIKERLTSRELLRNGGLGNEIGYYIFDYPPEQELVVRGHLEKVISQVSIQTTKIDLFDLLIDYLSNRGLLKPAIDLQVRKGDSEVFRGLRGSVDEEKRIAPEIAARVGDDCELVLLVGVGKVYPLLRTHRLLNCLQPLLRDKPLVVFYPGKYDGQSLSLFGRLTDENYYRAFRLVT